MAYYQTGNMIRLAREAVGLTREELADNICSVQTLYRMETGKTKVKRDVYTALMGRLERFSEKNYAFFSSADIEKMEEKLELDYAVSVHDYKKAYEHLCRLEAEAEDSIINQQVLKTERAIVYTKLEMLEQSEALKKYQEAIALTIPDYRKYLESGYPFTDTEYVVLMNIAAAYYNLENYEETVIVCKMIIKSLNLGYMSLQETGEIRICIKQTLATAMMKLEKYAEAKILLEEAKAEAQIYEYGITLPGILGALACNIFCQIDKGLLEITDKEVANGYIRQGYFVSLAEENQEAIQYFEYLIQDYLKEDIDEFLGLKEK